MGLTIKSKAEQESEDSCKVSLVDDVALITGTTSVIKDGEVVTSSEIKEEYPVDPVKENPARVGISMGISCPLQEQSFYHVRVDVRLDVPCELEDVDETYEQCKQWVESKVQEAIDETLSSN